MFLRIPKARTTASTDQATPGDFTQVGLRERVPRKGIINTIKGFKRKAVPKFPWSNWWIALKDPHPGQ